MPLAASHFPFAEPVHEQRVVWEQEVDRKAELLRLARSLYSLRRRRERAFSSDLFSDPNWDLLLDLFAAEQSGQRVSVTSAFVAASASPTTASRCLRGLETSGIVYREKDGLDGRRTNVRLTAQALDSMTQLLEAMLAEQVPTHLSNSSQVNPIIAIQIGR